MVYQLTVALIYCKLTMQPQVVVVHTACSLYPCLTIAEADFWTRIHRLMENIDILACIHEAPEHEPYDPNSSLEILDIQQEGVYNYYIGFLFLWEFSDSITLFYFFLFSRE